MTSIVSAITPGAPVDADVDGRISKLHRAAGEFEAVLVKQLLKEAHVTGSDKTSGYADMAIDALSSAVEDGGGLGLAREIELSLSQRR